jgi:GrpB-like predicted nucleotidyltransferase (UPF0157 family)
LSLIVPYSADWPARFRAEQQRIADGLQTLVVRIEHHGSTSVPGLAAKPIIDIQVSVRSLHPLQPYIDALRMLGYVHVPHADDERCPFFHQPVDWPHTHHVHLVEAGGDEERRTLAFRDYLRRSPDVAAEYEQLKQRIAGTSDLSTFAGREAYAAAKSEFIERMTRLALSTAGT